MQERAFEELHDGATVVKFDETIVHPVIKKEEYGGQNLCFVEGPLDMEWFDGHGYPTEHIMTYDPIKKESSRNYDAETDTYNNDIEYTDKGIIAECVVTGSRQKAKELLEQVPEDERKYVEQYMQYSSASLNGVREIISLPPEQRESYVYLFGNTHIPREKIKDYCSFTRDKLHTLNMLCVAAQRGSKEIWEMLLSNGAQDFLTLSDMKDAVYHDPTIIKYLDRVPGDKDPEDTKEITEDIIRIAKRRAEELGVSIKIPELEQKEIEER